MAVQSDLQQARNYIAYAEQRVADQEARIMRLTEEHQPIEAAEFLLHALREGLSIFRTNVVVLEAANSAGLLGHPEDGGRI
jgi:hypothetical protein